MTFETLDDPIHHNRDFRVVCIGAGLSGIHLAARVQQYGPGIDLQVYDRNPDVGGTWYSNRYPGVAVDSPSVSYTLSWAPWTGWSRFQAAGSDCLDYCNHLATITNIRKITRFKTTVDSIQWEDETSKWKLKLSDASTGEKFEDEANVIVNAGGILSQPKWPKVKNMEDYKGELLHSAYWRSVDLKGKRVALIGAGSSAIQILPQIQAQVGHLDTYIRSSTWVVPMFAHEVRDAYFGIDTSENPLHAFTNEDPDIINPWYTDEDRKMWKEKPETLLKHRKEICTSTNASFTYGLTHEGSDVSKQFREAVIEATRQKLSKKPDLIEVFTPNWDPGCRRATPGVTYHRAIQEDNVDVVRAGVSELTEDGLIDTNGVERKYDAIIFATGYNTNYAPPFQTTGLDGFSLNNEDYLKNPRAYFVAHTPKMPNYFSIGGPLLSSFNGEFLVGQEKIMDHILKFILKMQRERYKAVVVKERCVNNMMAFADHYLKRTVHQQDCSSWYKGGTKDGKIRAIWCGTSLHLMEAMRNPRWEDFDWAPMDSQDGPEQFLWLGNGQSQWDASGSEDLAPYIYLVEDTEKPVPDFDKKNPVALQGFQY